ncbi:LOW QUALITY PROTEIN: hypothetical protein ACHAW5_009632 [Stephanodiscus triporus]|uniref:SHSP domain-containing protein n=1 Tax=Stephanodiscus triporus TaxID=2934178 RepID=A0ABD3NET8_9STRA
MVSFLRSNKAVVTALLASALSAKTDAYGSLHFLSRPSTALASRMVPAFSGPSLLSRNAQRVMHDMDEMFDSMLGDMLYSPLLSLPRHATPLPPSAGRTGIECPPSITRPRNAHGIVQDDKQLKIVMDVQGAEASDVNLHLDEDGRVLRISGETKREEGGISVHSRFDRAFALKRDVDTSQISAWIDDGVLTIIAPKYREEEVKENVRRIEIVENKKVENVEAARDEAVDITTSHKEDESQKMEQEVDDRVIDLDLEQD